MNDWSRPIADRATAEAFLRWCDTHLSWGFHPDNSFGDYVSNGAEVFDPEEAAMLDARLSECFVVLDGDVYRVALENMNSRFVS